MGTDEEIVQLSRWRALLARSRGPRKRMEALLTDPAAPTVVRRLPAQDLFFLIRSVGLGDAIELIGLAAPEQLRACLDLDVWQRDRVDLDRIIAWLEILEAQGPARLAAAVAALDVELMAFLVRRHATVYDVSLDERPHPDTEHPVVATPDGFYLLEFTSPNRKVTTLLARLLDQLYKADADRAMSIVREARWSYPAELEESSSRWRAGRLADLGFDDYYEALAVYAELDPGHVEPDTRVVAGTEPEVLPVAFAETLGEEGFLGRVLGSVDDSALLGGLSEALVMLLNRVLAADLVDAGDLDRVRDTSARVRDTISLGLEHAAAGSVERAVALLATMPLVTLFRTGYSLSLPLARRGCALRDAGVDDPDLLPLLERRPLFPRALDVPPLAGARPFRTRADLERIDARLCELGG